MPQSLSKVIVHIIFSTKNSEPWLDSNVRPRVHGLDYSCSGGLRPSNVFWFTFQAEYRELLRKHGVDFDERCVWD